MHQFTVSHLMQSHIYRAHVHLNVTCHRHFWQNEWDLLCATAVTQGCYQNTKIRVYYMYYTLTGYYV